MFKIRRKIFKETVADEPEKTVYDVYLNDAKRVMFRLVFTLAQLAKVTPKQLAAAFSKAKTTEYVAKFNEELARAEEAMVAALDKSLNKKGKK